MEIIFYTPSNINLRDTFEFIQTLEYDVILQEEISPRLVIYVPGIKKELVRYWTWAQVGVFEDVYEEEKKSELKAIPSPILRRVDDD